MPCWELAFPAKAVFVCSSCPSGTFSAPKHCTTAVHTLPIMTGSIDVQTPATGEEKAVMKHREDVHQGDADGSSNEAGLQESEKDIPVRELPIENNG